MSGVLRRKIDINGRDFEIFGRAPWITIPVPATEKTPACHIIIEASLMAYILRQQHVSRHRWNALSTPGKLGQLIPVAFVGEDGEGKANDIVTILNAKMDK